MKNAQDQDAILLGAGQAVSEMGTLSDGRGRFVVWNPGAKIPAGKMTRSPQYDSGLLQVSNNTQPVASLTVGQLGHGHLDLTNRSGVSMVHRPA